MILYNNKMKTKSLLLVGAAISCMVLASCLGSSSSANAVGGEVTGVKGSSFSEPTPFGMVPVHKGSLKIGLEKNDTLWVTASSASVLQTPHLVATKHTRLKRTRKETPSRPTSTGARQFLGAKPTKMKTAPSKASMSYIPSTALRCSTQAR